MRAAQYLYAFDIGEIPVLSDLSTEIDAIHVDADTWVGRDQVILSTDAADKRIGRGRMSGGERRDRQIRYELANVHEVSHTAVVQLGSVKHAQGERHVVHALFESCGGHYDFLNQRRFRDIGSGSNKGVR